MEHLGLEKSSLDESLQAKPKTKSDAKLHRVPLWVEPWEEPLLTKKDTASQSKLLKKYGGLKFYDDGLYTISSDTIKFYKGKNCLVAMGENYNPDDDSTWILMDINSDLHGVLFDYIRRGNEPIPNKKLEARPEDLDSKDEWNNWLPTSPDKKSKKRKAQPTTSSSPRKSPRKKAQKKTKK
jgi:hypothetical protein